MEINAGSLLLKRLKNLTTPPMGCLLTKAKAKKLGVYLRN